MPGACVEGSIANVRFSRSSSFFPKSSARSPSLSCAVTAGIRIGGRDYGNHLDGRDGDGRWTQQRQDLSTAILHRAAGLIIAADAPIPGLPAATVDLSPEIHIHLDSPAPWRDRPVDEFHRSDYVDANDRPIVTVGRSSHGFFFSYADGTAVWIDTDGTNVWCTRPLDSTLEDLATYLTGPILGFVLRRRGQVSLHASAVQAGNGALILAGPHGAGKSTIAAALAARGCALVTDDVLHVRKTAAGWVAEPFASGLKLWPDAAALVFGPAVSLPRLTPTWDKRSLGVDWFGVTAAPQPVMVQSVLFLEWSDSDCVEPSLEPIGAAETVVRLATHGSAAHLLDEAQRAQEFHAFADLATSVRVKRAVLSRRRDTFRACIDRIHRWSSEDEACD
jgi:hypothetical protein